MLARDITLTSLVLLLLAAGAVLQHQHMWGYEESWLLAADVGLVTAVIRTLATLQRGRLAVDVVAVFALIGTIVLNEHFAGGVVALMVCSGSLLESLAAHRAARGLSLLASRAPTTARRVVGETMQLVSAAEVNIGDTLWVAAGDVVPVDGHILTAAVLDESSLTGEALPVNRSAGELVSSGVTALQMSFTMTATATSETSTYTQILRLVANAEAASAPMVRISDRWAVWFIGATAGATTLTYFIAGSLRAVSVLVIATPCPLILAAPIALISGIAVAAKSGVIIKGGAALEALARARTVLLDKTGTITVGHPRVSRIQLMAEGLSNQDEALSLAASVEQASPHVLAASVVESALVRGITLRTPTSVHEVPGKGIVGTVGDRLVHVGSMDYMHEANAALPAASASNRPVSDLIGDHTTPEPGSMHVYISVNRHMAASLTLTDEKRPDIAATLQRMRDTGITRMVMLTGDRESTARAVARGLPLEDVRAGVLPADKQRIVVAESAKAPTMMIGDGINDAPALAEAGVGVAIAARGTSAASQAADVVLVHDRLDAIVDARIIAIGSIRIAEQSVILGMTLCGIGMVAAMLGWLPSSIGAVVQEGIDLAAIGWALRATRIKPKVAARRA